MAVKKKNPTGVYQLVWGIVLGCVVGVALHQSVVLTREEPAGAAVLAQAAPPNACIVPKNPGDPCPAGSTMDLGTYCYADPSTTCTCPNTAAGTCGAGTCLCPTPLYCCQATVGTCGILLPNHPPPSGCTPQQDEAACNAACALPSSHASSCASPAGGELPCSDPSNMNLHGAGEACGQNNPGTCTNSEGCSIPIYYACETALDCVNGTCGTFSSSQSSQRCCSGNVCGGQGGGGSAPASASASAAA